MMVMSDIQDRRRAAGRCWKWFVCGALLLMALPTFWGCQRPVGGSCDYKEHLGTVEVVRTVEGGIAGIFSSVNDPLLEQSFEMEIPKGAQVTLFRHYPASLSVRTKGSCTPYFVDLLSDESRAHGINIPLDADGRLTSEAAKMVDSAAGLFTDLLSDWPDARLLIYGYAAGDYTEEYRYNLARHYEQQFRCEFIKSGLRPKQVRVADGVLADKQFLQHASEGNCAQLFFLLTPDQANHSHGATD